MCAAAVRAAEAVGYRGAGTVEMLLDRSGEFFFLEMNTRLQVEHPVTELVTGVDLVKAQLRIAAGEALDWDQGEIRQRGHAIEARVYAEDPARGFAPQAGPLLHVEPPLGPHLRVDAGFGTGCEVSVHYDPLLAKVIAWGESRAEAVRTLREGLRRYAILGPVTNLDYLGAILDDERFRAGALHVGFLDERLSGWSGAPSDADLDDALIAAAVADHLGAGPRGPDGGGGRGARGGAVGSVAGAGAGAEAADGGDPYSPFRGGGGSGSGAA
jgi:acetyl/propionyl-CoA carboxylase alpha subunit